MIRPKHKRLRVIVLSLIAIGLIGFAAYTKYGRKPSSDTAIQDTPYHPKAAESASPAPTPTPTPTPAPTPTTAPQTSSSGLISVTAPTAGATITSGTVISGTAQVDSGKIYWQVKGEKSGQLGSGMFQMTGDLTQPQAFSFPLAFTNQAMAGDSGEFEAYSISPTDGSEVNQVSVAVKF